MNFWDGAILLAVAVLVIWAAARIKKGKAGGCPGCCEGCAARCGRDGRGKKAR